MNAQSVVMQSCCLCAGRSPITFLPHNVLLLSGRLVHNRRAGIAPRVPSTPKIYPAISIMNFQLDQLAQTIWDYHQLHHQLAPSDLLLALGSNDIRVAEYAADLYLQGFAPLLMFSGNVGALTKDHFTKPEAEVFADIARQKGVPDEVILTEPESTNTGENILFSRRVLAARNLDPARIILVQKPYMERRAFATFRQQWPEKEVIVASPPIPWAEYPNELLPRDKVIHIMVGDLQRIKFYPSLGFQIAQEIPDDVWQAYETMISWGYDQHLMK
jgi:uncharacterized SAM-binding protein YcdF (DUF218 family)